MILTRPDDFIFLGGEGLQKIDLGIDVMPIRSNQKILAGKDPAYFLETDYEHQRNAHAGVTKNKYEVEIQKVDFDRRVNDYWKSQVQKYDGHLRSFPSRSGGYANPSSSLDRGNVVGQDGQKWENVVHDRLQVGWPYIEGGQTKYHDGYEQLVLLESIQEWMYGIKSSMLYKEPILRSYRNLQKFTRRLNLGVQASPITTLDPENEMFEEYQGTQDPEVDPASSFFDFYSYGHWVYNSDSGAYEWKWYRISSRGYGNTKWYCGWVVPGTIVHLYWVGTIATVNRRNGGESPEHYETTVPFKVYVGTKTAGSDGWCEFTSDEIGSKVYGGVRGWLEESYDPVTPAGDGVDVRGYVSNNTYLPEEGDSLWMVLEQGPHTKWFA